MAKKSSAKSDQKTKDQSGQKVKINRKKHMKNRSKNMVFNVVVTVVILAIIGYGLYSYMNPQTLEIEADPGNEAAQYCTDQGGTRTVMTDTNGTSYGVCVLPDGTACEELAYYNGNCPVS